MTSMDNVGWDCRESFGNGDMNSGLHRGLCVLQKIWTMLDSWTTL